MAGELTELATEDFEILLIYPYGEPVFSLRSDLFQKNIGLLRAVSRPAGTSPGTSEHRPLTNWHRFLGAPRPCRAGQLVRVARRMVDMLRS
jgi:hypothetical protein